MFKCIVYATDGSEHARRALKYAGDLTKLSQAKLYIVHAYASVSDLLGFEIYDNLLAHRIAVGRKILRETQEYFESAQIEYQTELLEGPMAEAIINVAEARGADLIIVGARGRSSLGGLVLGSVSQKIIHHSTCPVLVVH
jgi:nucleotide-binding universal stress UspA family protein